jgi:tRNA A-37 threonylcarbamoyl transferase component Bud32
MELTKDKLEKFIKDFETNPITVKWIESVENRGRYQRDLDTSFYELSRSTINKLIDLIVFMNTIYGSVDKVTEQIVVEQDKYLELVDEFETILKKLQNGNKG